MRSYFSLLVVCLALSIAGCGSGGSASQSPSHSDSTEKLVALLDQKGASQPHMLAMMKQNAIEIISTRGDAGLPVLFRLAQDESEEKTVRFMATEAIGKYRDLPAEYMSALLALRRGENGILVNESLQRACKAASKDTVVPQLVKFVEDESIDYDDRQFVALILLDIDEPAAIAAGVVKGTNPYLPNTKFMPDIKASSETTGPATDSDTESDQSGPVTAPSDVPSMAGD